jgi:hypothetical protein
MPVDWRAGCSDHKIHETFTFYIFCARTPAQR